jgi:hypothetical protein
MMCFRAGTLGTALLLSPLAIATPAAGPAYVPDQVQVAPYEAPPQPENLERLEVRELEARANAIAARLDRLDAMLRKRAPRHFTD